MPDEAASLPLTVHTPNHEPPTPAPADATPLAPDTVNDPNRTGPWQPPDSVDNSSLPDMPGFVLEKELGRGGMGVVYRARQMPLNRTVALKMILAGDHASAEAKTRFLAEAEAIAKLHHPGIVQVHEYGTHQGHPYFALEFLDGGSLDRVLAQGPLVPPDAARLVAQLADAMHAAHQAGIIHRDLKPANILLGGKVVRSRGGDTTSPPHHLATPKITDFGLAKQIDASPGLTASGAIMGTPSYMAPEQASGTIPLIGPVTDVYALGAILYECLTGRPPFRAATILDTLDMVRQQEPVPVRQLQPKVPRDLETICHKCLHKEPGKRYGSAAALAEDLRNYLDSKPITARPVGRMERAWKWCRRYPAVAALVVVTTLAAIVASGLAAWAMAAERQARQERDWKEEQRQLAERRLKKIDKGAELFAGLIKGIKPRAEEKGGPTVYEQLRERAEQAADQLEGETVADALTEARLQTLLGSALLELGARGKAIAILEKARSVRERELGVNHPDTLETVNNLGLAYLESGNLPSAIALLERVRSARPATRENDRSGTFKSLDNLACAYAAAGRIAEAVSLFEEVYAACVQELGPTHRQTLITLNNLATTYGRAGKLPAAVGLLEQVRADFVRRLGSDHFETLVVLNNLAGAYQNAGNPHRAEELFQQVLAGLKKKMGADHPETLKAMGSLAAALLATGKLDKAIELLEYVHKAHLAKLGPKHPDTLTTILNLADAYQAAGKPDAALPLFIQAKDGMHETLGPEHLDTLRAVNNLAGAYLEARKFAQALTLLEEIHQVRIRTLGAYHPDTLSAMNNLAVVYFYSRRLPDAIKLLEQLRDLQTKHLGAEHPSTIGTLGNLAAAYVQAGRVREAIPLHEQALKATITRFGPDHPDTLHKLNNLAGAYQDAGDLVKAVTLFEEAATGIVKRRFQHEHAALIIANTIRASETAQQYHKAETWRRHWLAHLQSRKETNPVTYAGELAGLGLNLTRQQKWTEAEATLRECLTIREKKQSDVWTTFNTMSMLGGALLGQKKYTEAEPLLLKGYAGMKQRADKIPPQAKSNLSEALERLVQLYEATSKPDEAAKWRKERADVQKAGGK